MTAVLEYLPGFNNHFESEALPDALPKGSIHLTQTRTRLRKSTTDFTLSSSLDRHSLFPAMIRKRRRLGVNLGICHLFDIRYFMFIIKMDLQNQTFCLPSAIHSHPVSELGSQFHGK